MAYSTFEQLSSCDQATQFCKVLFVIAFTMEGDLGPLLRAELLLCLQWPCKLVLNVKGL